MNGSSAAADLDPAGFAHWLGHGLSADLLGRMLSVPRLAATCRRLLDRRLGPVPDASSPAVAAALAMDGLALLGLAQRAGAVWHARSILRFIDGASVRALLERIGPSLRLLAIRHAVLAAGIPMAPGDAAGAPDPDRLAEAIGADGLACLTAWCDARPPALGRRVLLRLPRTADARPEHRAHGPAIVDALLLEPL